MGVGAGAGAGVDIGRARGGAGNHNAADLEQGGGTLSKTPNTMFFCRKLMLRFEISFLHSASTRGCDCLGSLFKTGSFLGPLLHMNR